jgi:hypothetical protein
MLLLLCCALNREYTMRQPLKHSCHKDLEKVSGSEAYASEGALTSRQEYIEDKT